MTRLTVHRPHPLLCAALCVFACARALSADNPSAKKAIAAKKPATAKEKLAKSLFAKFRASRLKLRSGMFEAMEMKASKHPERGEHKTFARIFSAFDYKKGLLRYDDEPGDAAPTKRYFRTLDRSVLYSISPRARFLSIRKPDGFKKRVEPLDARLFGFVSMFEQKIAWSRGSTFETFYSLYTERCRVKDVRKRANNQFHIILSHTVGKLKLPVERHLWIDAAKDYVPVRYQHRHLDPRTKKWSKFHAVVETKWTKQSGIRVPVSIHSRSGTRSRTITKLRLTWNSINEKVPEIHFQRKGLNPKPGTEVIDFRSGKPKRIEVIGKPKP